MIANRMPSPIVVNNSNAENENPPKRRSTRITRSSKSLVDGTPTPEKAKPKQLPFVKYKGEIKYYTQGIDIAAASDELMQWVNSQGDLVPIAFDMEWPFTFQTGSGKSALIQLCADEKICYLFHLTELKKIPAALMALLSHPKVRLHGVNIKNDIRKLKRDFPEVTIDTLIENCIDLGPWCNEVCNTGGRWSLDRLSGYICEKAVDKNKKVRMSKWNVVPLDDNQKMYAAIDVYNLTSSADKLSFQEEDNDKFTGLISPEDDRAFTKLLESNGHQIEDDRHSEISTEKNEHEIDESETDGDNESEVELVVKNTTSLSIQTDDKHNKSIRKEDTECRTNFSRNQSEVEFKVTSRTPTSFNSETHVFHMDIMQKKTRSTGSIAQQKSRNANRKSFSFSNDRMREIERHNQILLRKILTQKPRKETAIAPNMRTASAAVNRKKQQRQIDLDNVVLKRKIEAISLRRPQKLYQ